MMRRHLLQMFPLALLFSREFAFSNVYLTPEAVRGALFPNATQFIDRSLTLTKAQAKHIAKASSVRVNSTQVKVMAAYANEHALGTLFIDQVYGKHEFITYALSLDLSGTVSGLEIMEYRESYGDQIRNVNWRRQFFGTKYGQPLRIDEDIQNISGATLSCVHITNGVRRLLTTYELVFVDG